MGEPRWFVIRFFDGATPVEVTPFVDEAQARKFHDLARLQWSECFLTRAVVDSAGREVAKLVGANECQCAGCRER